MRKGGVREGERNADRIAEKGEELGRKKRSKGFGVWSVEVCAREVGGNGGLWLRMIMKGTLTCWRQRRRKGAHSTWCSY